MVKFTGIDGLWVYFCSFACSAAGFIIVDACFIGLLYGMGWWYLGGLLLILVGFLLFVWGCCFYV